MARNARLDKGIQVFRGSRPRQDVFAVNSGSGCCDSIGDTSYDKLAERTRFDNGLLHSNPIGGNDKFNVPYGDGFADARDSIVRAINEGGVGTHISVLAIPTYAFVTGIGIHVSAEEPGLTFDLVTRNGLVLPGAAAASVLPVTGGSETVSVPNGSVTVVTATATTACEITRTLATGSEASFEGFGALGSAAFIDIFGRDGQGQFSLEADEIALRVATMPAGGIVNGEFNIKIAVSYEMIHRAER